MATMLPYKWWVWDRARQRKGQQGRGSRRAPRYFFLLIFYLLSVYSHLELLWWQQTATTTAHHLHLHTECRLEAQLHLEFWYVNFFCPLLNNYLLLDCMYRTATRTTTVNSYHLWDNKWGLEMHHLCLKSLVCFFFFFFYIFLDMFLFCFFILVLTYLDMSTTTTTILSNRSSRHVVPGKVFLALSLPF